ncbi:MAG: dihydrofolate reductase family protein [Candidatus Saccharimonadales bacterium]
MWEPTVAYTDVRKLNDIREQPGKDIAVLGSSNLCVSLLEAGLLDEVRIMVNPAVIGKGTPLFDSINTSLKFILTTTRTFANGNELLIYKADG